MKELKFCSLYHFQTVTLEYSFLELPVRVVGICQWTENAVHDHNSCSKDHPSARTHASQCRQIEHLTKNSCPGMMSAAVI
jgi:hypothetical protein